MAERTDQNPYECEEVYERNCLVDLSIDGRRILKCVLKKQNVRV
jgi:hypothetical protein